MKSDLVEISIQTDSNGNHLICNYDHNSDGNLTGQNLDGHDFDEHDSDGHDNGNVKVIFESDSKDLNNEQQDDKGFKIFGYPFSKIKW